MNPAIIRTFAAVNARLPVLLLLLIWLLPLFNFAQTVVLGRVDLSEEKFDNESPVYLHGEWSFYWNQFLSANELQNSKPDEFIQVPSSWRYSKDRPVLGYATYRLKIILPHDNTELSLYLPIVNSAAKIFMNGEFVFELGKVGTSPATHEGKLNSSLIPIPDKVDSLDLVIHVSNFNYFSAGLPRSPQIA